MNTIRNLVFMISIVSLMTMSINAQVTIGSETQPSKGALLDLKEESITTKGLGMPRVQLKDIGKLIMGDNAIANEGTVWLEHTGLLVYNINKCFDKGGDGMYVWDGSLWQRLPERNLYEDALYQPNSYWVAPGTTTIKIPVEKAFRIWEYYGSGEGKNRLPAESVTGNLIPVLYWQDAPIILSQTSLSISGNERSDIITVSLAGGTVKGNAVVALKDGSGTIRWSWHIWVTDDPTTASLNGGDFTWMDRHLGATSATAGDVGTIGLTYQWGRKDPFPMAQTWASTEPTLQNSHGELATSVDKSLTNENTPQVNLKNSISSPLSFISTASAYDWYKLATSTDDSWDGRWSRTEAGCLHKSPFDPCPEGWKVPAYKYDDNGVIINNTSPWQNLTNGSGELLEKRAMTWNDFGVYPLSGYRQSSGKIVNTTLYAYVWAASVSSAFKAYYFYYGSSFAQHSEIARGFGFSVRCVRE